MLSPVNNLLGNRKTLPSARLLVSLISAIVIVAFCQKDEDVYKREQKLQIDVAFIIHGSKNITSPERKKTLKDSLDWAKKIVKAFGEVGINKTRVGLILYAEKPKVMFNFTEKLKKDEVLGAIDEAASPPAIGNKTFTGKALWLALKTLVEGTREEALKKFFVFSDRPPDDDPISPASAIQKKKVDVYGLGKTTAPFSDWYISDYSLDTMYAVLAAGPFNGGKNQKIVSTFQNQLSEKTSSTDRPAFPSTTKENSVVTTQPSRHPFNSASKVSEENRPTLHVSRNTQNSGNSIASVITTVEQPKEETLPKIKYGNDASVVVTENSEKSGKSVGRYATGTDISYKSTDFGTVIRGKKPEGQTQFSVIKPVDQSTGEDSNVRSDVGSNRKRG